MKTLCKFYLCALLAATSVMLPTALHAVGETMVMQDTAEKRLEANQRKLDARVEKLEGQARIMTFSVNGVEYQFSLPYEVGIGLMIGFISALWAQNNRRNAWLWFFLGVFFAPVALIVILVTNGRLRREQREALSSPQSNPLP
jgi:hypothetical protein